jgi:hypothetical protein
MLAKVFHEDVFLLVSAQTCRPELLTDIRHVATVLEEIPRLIGMRPIGHPQVLRAENNPGLEAYIPLDLSSITISTYVNPARIVIVIHSCRGFDHELALEHVRESFACLKIRSHYCSEAHFR